MSPVYTNCLISGNVAGQGSAVYNNDGLAEFINCTMSGNFAVAGGAFYSAGYTNSSDPQLDNCIIWHNNSISVINGANGNPVFTYSDIQASGGSSAWVSSFGTDVGYNIDTDPVFASKISMTGIPTNGGDLRLTSASPCLDEGQDSYISELFDIRGNAYNRFLLKSDHNQVGPVDMGAFEYKEGTDPLSPMASLITKPVTSITNSGGETGGISINDNGAAISQKGIVWSTGTNPVLTDNVMLSAPADTSAFTLIIANAPGSTTIHVRAFATNSGGTAYGEERSFLTLANVPDAPFVNNLTLGKLNIRVNPNSNQVNTEFAIREITTGKYLQTDGNLLSSPVVWRTMSDWGTKAVSGLTVGTTYSFQVKARNSDLVETAFGAATSGIPADGPVMTWVPTDKIASWTQVRTPGVWTMNVSGSGNTVIAANARLNISTDYGTTWSNLEPIGNADGGWGKPAMLYSGDTILVGSKSPVGRLWRSYNKGVSWTEVRPANENSNLSWTGLSVSDNGVYMYATKDNSPYKTYRSIDAGLTWTELSIFTQTNDAARGGVDFYPTQGIMLDAMPLTLLGAVTATGMISELLPQFRGRLK